MSTVIGSVVTFNPEWKIIETTIRSFLDSKSSLKVVVWDNSSEDKLSNRLKEIFGEKVIYHHSNENSGYGKGNNSAFKLIKDDCNYFCVLNPDIKLPTGAIDEFAGFMDAHPQYGLATGSIVDEHNNIAPVHKLMPAFWDYFWIFTFKKFLKKDIKKNLTQAYYAYDKTACTLPITSGCFMFFRSSHYTELGGFDERYFLYFEDWDISVRSFMAKKSIILPNIRVFHEWGRHSHKKAKILLIHIKSALAFYAKWGFTNKLSHKLNEQASKINLELR